MAVVNTTSPKVFGIGAPNDFPCHEWPDLRWSVAGLLAGEGVQVTGGAAVASPRVVAAASKEAPWRAGAIDADNRNKPERGRVRAAVIVYKGDLWVAGSSR